MLQLVVMLIVVLLVLGLATTGDVLAFFKAILAAIVSVLMALINLIT